MSHIIRSNAGKKIDTISELFIKQKIVFNFVYFSSAQTLIGSNGGNVVTNEKYKKRKFKRYRNLNWE